MVDILSRYPWVFRRFLLLGWNVRFIGSASPVTLLKGVMIGTAARKSKRNNPIRLGLIEIAGGGLVEDSIENGIDVAELLIWIHHRLHFSRSQNPGDVGVFLQNL